MMDFLSLYLMALLMPAGFFWDRMFLSEMNAGVSGSARRGERTLGRLAVAGLSVGLSTLLLLLALRHSGVLSANELTVGEQILGICCCMISHVYLFGDAYVHRTRY